MMDNIVSTAWLFENQHNDDVIILNARLKQEIGQEKTIPKSRLFDLKNIFSDQTSEFPNTVPPPAIFEKECRKLGINNECTIVIYDQKGIYSSPRAWWLFKIMGHTKVTVLDGGLPAWIAAGYPTEEIHNTDLPVGNFKSNYREDYVKTYEDILRNNENKSFTIVDARSNGRFEGTAKEPRAWLQSGHMPHSVNIPYTDVLTDGKFKSTEELSHLFNDKLQNTNEIVFSCGSGITACIIMLAQEISLGSQKTVYDGSWTEYAEKQQLTNK